MSNPDTFVIARNAISDCEDKTLPMVLLTINEKGNLNVITNVPQTPDSIASLLKVLDNAKAAIAQKLGN